MAKFIEVTDRSAPHTTRYLNIDKILYLKPVPNGVFIQTNYAFEDTFFIVSEDYETVKELING